MSATVQGRPATGDDVSSSCWANDHASCNGSGIFEGAVGACRCDCHSSEVCRGCGVEWWELQHCDGCGRCVACCLCGDPLVDGEFEDATYDEPPVACGTFAPDAAGEEPVTLLELLRQAGPRPVAPGEHDCGAAGCVLRGLRPAEIEVLGRRFGSVPPCPGGTQGGAA